MFDPTAFDNMKVVIEGALYDLDISGDIVITDRNDSINMAKMSRKFDVSFQLPTKGFTAKIEMISNLGNLAAELLPALLSEQKAGCQLSLQFYTEHDDKEIDFQAMEATLLDVWGSARKITQIIQYDPLHIDKKHDHIISIEFDRLIREDQMDDLVEMTEFIITTLKKLNGEIN
ncbi:hypothetical protein KW850_22725 [Bacillus sp. sid0103]|uniref:hypothetical protein n=1 Tax=Bacillus sp. sid0103 TaxID=2856337 RepID=UPI001C4555C6|nr:hypothetical protein [Bacillus sp. sid0103]MBV7508035.1 hypothetical protein [Bacillus sp. sid0103]